METKQSNLIKTSIKFYRNFNDLLSLKNIPNPIIYVLIYGLLNALISYMVNSNVRSIEFLFDVDSDTFTFLNNLIIHFGLIQIVIFLMSLLIWYFSAWILAVLLQPKNLDEPSQNDNSFNLMRIIIGYLYIPMIIANIVHILFLWFEPNLSVEFNEPNLNFLPVSFPKYIGFSKTYQFVTSFLILISNTYSIYIFRKINLNADYKVSRLSLVILLLVLMMVVKLYLNLKFVGAI